MPQLGDTLRFSTDLYDKPAESGGVLINATTATLTVTKPDGTTTTPTVPAPATTGKYFVDVATVVGGPTGPYRGAWLFTLASGATVAYQETFDVSTSLVTLDEVTAHLRSSGILTRAEDIDQLEWLAAVATDAIERDLRRVLVRRTVTEIHNGGRYALPIRTTPVISVTSVVESGVTRTAFVFDPLTGLLYKGSFNSVICWLAGVQNVTVTLAAGYNDPPRIARKVALNAIERMWQTSQQAGHPLLDDVSADSAVFASVAGTLTPIEQGAYNALRVVGP
jgi:hypothetical protein